MNEKSGSSRSSTVVPFLLGGVVGMVFGFLIAPKSGSETRKQIQNIATDTRDRITSTIGKGIDMYDDAKIAMTSALSAGKQAYLQERQKFQTVQ